MTGPRRPPSPLRGELTLVTPLGAVLSDRRIRLLEAIGEHGSLTAAARAVPMSYKAAWDALEAMNELAPQPLVERSTGGVGGGGTRLTPHARQLVALFRVMQDNQQDVLDRLAPLPEAADSANLRTLVRRLSMRTSARNQWPAHVLRLQDQGGLIEATLSLGERDAPGEAIAATITPESAETLELAPGREVLVLLKAPSVRITAQRPRPKAGRNLLAGTVEAVRGGAAHTTVTLVLASGRHLTGVASEGGSWTTGQSAWGSFDGDRVVLVSFG